MVHLPYRFSFADFKSVFKNRLRFGGKWRETKQSTLFISSRRINIVMESTRRTDANNTCVVFPLLRNFNFVFSRVHVTLQPTLSVCRMVGRSVGRSVTLSFFSPFYVILSHFKSFKVI